MDVADVTRRYDTEAAPRGAANISPLVTMLGLRLGDRVLVVGGYGVRNVGDEAILAGLMKELPEGVRLRVVSRSPQATASLHGVDAVAPPGVVGALLRSDALIVGGGGIFSGHMGTMSRLIPILGMLARARGARVAFHGVGVYPSTPVWVQRCLRWLAGHSVPFTVRDRASLDTLRSWGVTARQVPDLSAGMPAAPFERGAALMRSLGLREGVPTVALCLTATERRLEARLLEAIPQAIEALPEAQFCFVPMSQHPRVPRHNDVLLAGRLAARAPRLSVLDSWQHPSEVLALFGHVSVAVCMRYHSMLFAQRAGIAIVPIPYAEKCESWLEECGLTPVELTGEALAARLRQALPAIPAVGGAR